MKRRNLKEQINTKRWKKLAGIITEADTLGGDDPMKLGGIDQKFAKAAYTTGTKDKTGSDDEDKIAFVVGT